MTVEEVIVVEGRDDTCAVRAALDCETIETHGYGITKETWDRLAAAYRKKGLIILTDPDHAGGGIRKRIKERFPDAKEAFLPRAKAERKGDIGIENASPEAIREAIEKAHAEIREQEKEPGVTRTDLVDRGLSGMPESSALRRKAGDLLGIGYANTGTFLKRLNAFGITLGELDEALRTADDQADQK